MSTHVFDPHVFDPAVFDTGPEELAQYGAPIGDLALDWNVFAADVSVVNGDLKRDAGLQSAVLLSLFTDRRAEATDVLPDGTTNRRGWWGDAYPSVDGDLFGSRLWLLSRETQRNVVLERSKAYALEALQWLLDDRIAATIVIATGFVRGGMLGLQITVERPTGARVAFRYAYLWDGQAARVEAV